MRLAESIHIRASQQEVWDYITDFTNYGEFVAGLTRWELEGEKQAGLGARYRLLVRAGSADVGGLIEVVEWDPPCDLAFSSVTGVDQRGRWRLRNAGEGVTKVEFRWAYGIAGGGIAALIAERISSRSLRRDLKLTLIQLKAGVEKQAALSTS